MSAWQDARYGIRGLLKQPGFSITAVLTLALGIGASTTIYSVIENVLLDPYPMYRNVDRMVGVMIHDDSTTRPGGRDFFQTPEFLDYAAQMTSFDAVIAGTGADVIYSGTDGAEQFSGSLVSTNTFTVLGIDAFVGRTFVSDDGRPGAPPVCLISYKLWVRRFGMDASVVGRQLTLDGVSTTLIGVMPPRVSKMGSDIWRPVRLDRGDPATGTQFFKFQAHLKPGITIDQADAEFRAVALRIARDYPRNYPTHFTGRVVGFVDSVVRGFKTTLYTMAAAVGLLLLIACANVANLLLSRAAGRQRELAVRSSLGATRARLVGQLLVESVLLALGAVVAGSAIAVAGIKAVVAAMPEGLIPRESLIRLDGRALLFSIATAGVTVLLVGIAPALRAVRRDLMNPLRTAGKGIGDGFRGGRLRGGLVIFEIALSLVLLTSAGVLMRSFVRLQSTSLGFEPRDLLLLRAPVVGGRVETAAGQTRFALQALARIRSLPGVRDASTTIGLPGFGAFVTVFDVPGVAHQDKWRGALEFCSDGYLRTLGVPLLQGRDFTHDDLTMGHKVALVNRRFVERFLGGTDPIGRTTLVALRTDSGAIEDTPFQIVGVVENAKNNGVVEPTEPEVFLPHPAGTVRSITFVVRTAGQPLLARKTIEHEIWTVDPAVPIAESDTLEGYLARLSYAAPRLGLAVFTAFGSIGLILVVVGVYSLIAYTVSCQTREIGVRIAIGAARGDVLRLTIGLAVRWLTAGAATGVAASYLTTRLVASELYEVSPTDPVTFVAVVGVLLVAGLAASYFPARRASLVDPIVVLRAE